MKKIIEKLDKALADGKLLIVLMALTFLPGAWHGFIQENELLYNISLCSSFVLGALIIYVVVKSIIIALND